MSDNILNYPCTQPVGHAHRWVLAGVMVTVILFGWRYPVLGYLVPVVMLIGIAGSFFRGRYVCGNICPRGSFYDTIFRFVAGSRPIPPMMSKSAFRWSFMVLLMSALAFQIAQKPTDYLHWGYVFWTACAVTTLVGIVLGMVYRARSWCAFCPVGTMAAAIGGKKYRLEISDSCRGCGVCEKSCPMGFDISTHRSSGILPYGDCLKCSSCVGACKVDALTWPT